MKGIVVYYSATGNTKKIARAIHRGMQNSMEKCDISTIKDIDPQELAKYDVIGIGSPIWYHREPANVKLFIYKMPQLEGKQCFLFCSHGDLPFGIFLSMAPALQKKGLTIIGHGDWYGSNYQVLYAPNPYATDGHPDMIDLKEAEDFGREMAERAGKIAAGDKRLIPDLKEEAKTNSTFRPYIMGQAFQNKEKSASAPAHAGPPPKPERKIDMTKCLYPNCTICVDNCPANTIDLSANPPVIKQNCLNDSICDRMCPTGAIVISDEDMKRHRSMRVINMKKCKYPKCTVCVDHCAMNSIDFSVTPPVIRANCEGDDLCWVICPEGAIEITNLDETHRALHKMISGGPGDHDNFFTRLLADAETQGKFRRLVPKDKIGWDNPLFNLERHPRFSIDELLRD